MEATSNDPQPHRGAWEPSEKARIWTYVPTTRVCCPLWDCFSGPSVLNSQEKCLKVRPSGNGCACLPPLYA